MAALETQFRDLSERVRHSEQDAAAARVLAGGADRDVTEIRGEIRDFRQASTSSFNAMRADLTDLRADLTDLRADLTDLRADLTDLRADVTDLRTHVEDGFAKVYREFARVDRGFAEMRGRLDAAAAGQQQIVELLNSLIGQQGDQM